MNVQENLNTIVEEMRNQIDSIDILYPSVKFSKRRNKKLVLYKTNVDSINYNKKTKDEIATIVSVKTQYGNILNKLRDVEFILKSIIDAEIYVDNDPVFDLNKDNLVNKISKIKYDLNKLIEKYDNLQIF